jgi:hypothetical protein
MIDRRRSVFATTHRMLRMIACGSVALLGCAKQRAPTPDAAVTLPDDTAGKACKRDADCATGRCATTLQLQPAAPVSAAPGGYCTLDCATDSECGRGGECLVAAGEMSGQCLRSCFHAEDCRAGYSCVGSGGAGGIALAGQCRPKPATSTVGDGAVGLACVSDADCKGGQCAASSPLGPEFPGHYCTGRCLEDAQCGAGGVCLVLIGSADAGHCYQACSSDADCTRDPYRCWTLAPNFQACYPAQRALPDHTAGNACSSDHDCADVKNACASMLPADDFAAPGGYCTQACSLDAQCGAGAQCISRGFSGGTCLGSCATASDCRAGYLCWAHGRDHNETDRVCIPEAPSIAATPP